MIRKIKGHSGRTVKRRRTAYVKGVGVVPSSSIFPASKRGNYRTGGNYGRFGSSGRSHQEMKFIDNVLDPATITTTGAIRPTGTSDHVTPNVAQVASGTLLQVAQGDQAYQRNGKRITIKRISARLTVSLPPDVTVGTGDIYRIMLVLDTQCNGAAPAVTDVISYPGQTLSQDSFNNLENSQRFRTIADVMRPINATAGGVSAAASTTLVYHHVKINKKCNLDIDYSTSATTGALATIKSNNLFLLVISKEALVTMEGNIRIRYTDS